MRKASCDWVAADHSRVLGVREKTAQQILAPFIFRVVVDRMDLLTNLGFWTDLTHGVDGSRQ